jgi:hypothetical protein
VTTTTTAKTTTTKAKRATATTTTNPCGPNGSNVRGATGSKGAGPGSVNAEQTRANGPLGVPAPRDPLSVLLYVVAAVLFLLAVFGPPALAMFLKHRTPGARAAPDAYRPRY